MIIHKLSEFRWKKEQTENILQIPLCQIRTNPYQPRRSFQRSSLEELSASLRSYGMLEPLLVRKMGVSCYELVAGERRLRAAEIAGLERVPVRVVQVSEQESALWILTENLQQKPLTFLEEAEGYQALMKDYGFSIDEIASKIGKSKTHISECLRILKLEEPIRRLLVENAYTMRHARALLRLPDDATRMFVLEQIIRKDLTAVQTEAFVDEVLQNLCCRLPVHMAQKEKQVVRDARLFRNTLKQAIELVRRAGGEAKWAEEESDEGWRITIELNKQGVQTS